MENTFTVKNFRLFNGKGASFKFKPITFLTGTNGSGKSTLTKAIMLMHDYFTQTTGNDVHQKGFLPFLSKLDFSRPVLKLGGFNVEYHKGSSTGTMSFMISGDSESEAVFSPNAEVEYSFTPSQDNRSQGSLSTMSLRFNNVLVLKLRQEDKGICIEHFDIYRTDFGQAILLICCIIYLFKAGNSDGEHCSEGRQILLKIAATLDGNCSFVNGINSKGNNDYCFGRHNLKLFELTERIKAADFSVAKAIDKYFNNHILFYFPVLEKFKGLNKEDVRKVLKSAPRKFDAGPDWVAVGRLFLKSGYSDFLEFYVNSEREYLSMKASSHISRENYLQQNVNTELLIRELLDKVQTRFTPNDYRSDSFITLYSFLSNWQWAEDELNNVESDYINRIYEIDNSDGKLGLKDSQLYPKSSGTWESLNLGERSRVISEHKLFLAYTDVLQSLLPDILCPIDFKNVNYFGDFHTNNKRAYYLDDVLDPFVSKLRNYFYAISEVKSINDILIIHPGAFIDKWLKELEIGDSLIIHHDEDGKVVHLFVQKNDSEDSRISLADEGYGIFQLVALLISIETEMLLAQRQMRKDWGPEGLFDPAFDAPPRTLIIEEPEANLHPAFQSKLAELFYSATYALPQNAIQFIIETHSEYLIRASQAIVAKTVRDEDDLKKIPFVVYYIEKDGETYDMEYQVSGRFKKPFGTGFFDEAGKSSIEVLRKERRMRDEAND